MPKKTVPVSGKPDDEQSITDPPTPSPETSSTAVRPLSISVRQQRLAELAALRARIDQAGTVNK